MNISDKEVSQGIVETLKELQSSINTTMHTCRMMHAQTLAQRSAIQALIASHPNPRSAFEPFTDHMDSVETDDFHPEFLALLRKEMEELQQHLVRAANAKG